MATMKWGFSSITSNLLGTQLNSLADGSQSAKVEYDNSSNRNLYAQIKIKLGSFTPGTDPYLLLRVLTESNSEDPDAGVGGDIYKLAVATGTGAKIIIFPMIRIYPFVHHLFITNEAGAALASSGHSLYVEPYTEVST